MTGALSCARTMSFGWPESGATTYARHLPIVPVEGCGTRLRDRNGKWFIDCLAGAGGMSLGYNHPMIREALLETITCGAPLQTLDLPNPLRDAFLDELYQVLPGRLAADAVVHFCAPSGANAVEAALLVSEIATGGWEHVAAEGGFHGCSRGARAVSSGPRRYDRIPPSPPVHFIPYPQDYRCPFGIGGTVGVELAIRDFERLLFAPTSPLANPASLITEFVQGEAGCLPAPVPWMRAIREGTSRRGMVLIADEIQAGFCRTGKMWAFEHGGIEPDVIVMSKGIGGGLPIAVIVMRSELNRWPEGAFTGTFRGSALAFAAARACLVFARQNDLARRVMIAGARLKSLLAQTTGPGSPVADVRGRGLMLGAEIVDPEFPADRRGVRPPAPELARAVQRACFERGLIVEIGGVHGNVVRLLPPLTIEDGEINLVGEIVCEAVHATRRGVSELVRS